jgi:hypothetical protein
MYHEGKKEKKGKEKKRGFDSEDLSVPSIHLIVLGLSSIYFFPPNKIAFPAHLHPLSLTRHDYFSHHMHAIMLLSHPPLTFFLFLEKKGKEG